MKSILLLLFSAITFVSLSQVATVSGTVTDNTAKMPVVGAKIILSPMLRAISDLDGNYTIKDVPFGKYEMVITMLSFDTMTVKLNIDKENFEYEVLLGGSQEIEEMNVTGNLAQDRKTPVAVSTIGKKEITEELGSQDLPMILNSKPGVHATQQGGGDGDARITIRGFSQRNVGVMIDGVPVNDMENGWVYWSNWFGLDAITSQVQLQRGLGATKLALPSVGGTMNILTQNTGGKREIKVRQEYGTGTFLRTSLSYKSGTLKNGWGVLFAGSYKQGNGWVDGLTTQGAFYYLKVQKKIKNHVVSLSGFGAPQKHGQRSYSQKIEYWDSEYARKLGVTNIDTSNMDNGIKYNPHWGNYTDSATGKTSLMNERLNYFYKPQFTLKDFWRVNEKLTWSNIAYLSIGRGGGQRYYGSSSTIIRDSVGQIAWNEIEYNNKWISQFGMLIPTTDASYDDDLLKSSQILSASVNNHMWIGGISQFDYTVNDKWKTSGGLDYRWYKGSHYVEVKNLLGGDYFVSTSNANADSPMNVVGDKISDASKPYQNYRDAFVQWAGAFGQAEYSHGRWNAFVNISGVSSGYKGVDYFRKKSMQVGDSLVEIGYADTVVLNGQTITRETEGLEFDNTGWIWKIGGTFKAGANFNVTEKSNVFINLGYLSRTPQYSNVVDNNKNEFFADIKNEVIYAFEAGYGFRSKKLSINANGYYTVWKNKPFPFGIQVPDPNDPLETVTANVNGMDALHMGVEVDASYRVHKKLTIEGMVSVGDWTWQSSETIDVVGTQYIIDAKGVHVGDAAQSTAALSLRFAPIKRGYIKVKYTFFDRYYSDFDPFKLQGSLGGTESWQMPEYGLMSIHVGYRFKFEKSSLVLRGNVFNALNTLYISDARASSLYGNDFTANSVGVFIGQGIRFNLSLGFEF
mgnify:FL=1|tara:strand:+ start:58282 stop:61014 length:2733 start_codon:yes stop_codon:yes gene_type:complete